MRSRFQFDNFNSVKTVPKNHAVVVSFSKRLGLLGDSVSNLAVKIIKNNFLAQWIPTDLKLFILIQAK